MKKGKRILIIITIGLMMCSFQVAAQKWKPLGNGIPKPIQVSYIDSTNNLYVAYTVDSFINDTTYIGSKVYMLKWDGKNWINIPGFSTRDQWLKTRLSCIVIKDGYLWLTGAFDSIVGIGKVHGFVKYSINGNNWSAVTSDIAGQNITSLLVYKNHLYIAGGFDKINGNTCNNIALGNGAQWSAIGTVGYEGVDNSIQDMIILNNKLYFYPINGFFRRTGNINDTAYAGSWDGNNWAIINKPTSIFYDTGKYAGKVNGLATYNNNLFAYSKLTNPPNNYMCYWDGSSWKKMMGNLSSVSLQTVLNFKNQFWAAGSFKFNSDPKNYKVIIWDGTGWIPYIGINFKTGQGIGKFLEVGGQLIVTGTFDSLDGVLCNNIAMLDLKVGKIGGKVYYDSNSNCVKDSNERGIASDLIEIQPGSHYVSTDENGKYEAYVDTGKITLNLVPNNGFYKYWKLTTCNPLNYNVHVGLTTVDTNNNFGMEPFTNIKDLGISLDGESGFMARPGRTESYSISYKNTGTATITTGSVNLTLDSNVTLQTASPNYSSYTKPYVSWTFNNLPPGEKRMINLKIRIDTSLSIYDTLRYYASIQPTTDDADLPDNYDTLKQKIATAIDPNDKQCSPDSNILPQTSKIDYLIRFQNTGNYVAYRVRVVDTVSENLPMTKILIKTASHKYDLKVKDNVLTWTFNDIMLPDSFVDEPNSHGYIRYTAFIKPGLSIGTKITNTAYIYFDYQPPVATKSTVNIITQVDENNEPSIIGNKYYRVYPNPASGQLNIIYLGKNLKQELWLFNSLGQRIMVLALKPGEKGIIDISQLATGLYLLKDDNNEHGQKIIVSH